MGAAQAARHRLAFDELLRLQLILVMRKRAVEREARGIRHRVDGQAGRPVPRRPALSPDRSSAAGDLRDPGRPGRPPSRCTGCCRATSARARRSWRWPRCSPPCRAATRARSWRRPRCWPSSTTSGCGRCSPAWPSPTTRTLMPERPLRVALLTNRTSAAERARLHAGLADGTVDILIGTHALLTEQVAFRSLGVVVIDEQHRFGVEQRAALRAKGEGEAVPDVLVMTATPIPRTAAMTVYGDLDSTILDELPPGRTPVSTDLGAGPARGAGGVGPGPRPRSPPATRPTWCARWSRSPSGSRPARRPRSWPGCRPRCCPASASGCSTASCRPGTRRR